MKRKAIVIVLCLVAGLLAGTVPGAGVSQAGPRIEYLVVFATDASHAEATAALRNAGATVIRTNRSVGIATVSATDGAFASTLMSTGLFRGVAKNRPVGRIEQPLSKVLEKPGSLNLGRKPDLRVFKRATSTREDPLSVYQWSNHMVDADFGGSYSVEQGDGRVLLGIMDSGIEAKHHDLKARVDRELSRSFVTDIPEIDGPCEDEKDKSCEDAPLTDPGGHGTSVASFAAASLNGFGISGVAPGVTLVDLRVGQDASFIFMQPVVDALTHAADNSIDVVNMSFWIDPWWLNCTNNPADSPEERLEQQTYIAAMQEAADYARAHGVTLVAALGNDWMDIGDPRGPDVISPTFPLETAREREVDSSCVMLPQETDGVIDVVALGPDRRKSFYSTYGLEQATVAAPGGDDFNNALPYPQSMVMGAISIEALKEFDLINRKGKPLIPEIIRACKGKRCSYYAYGAGTSFAAPVAAGIAALIVSRFGQDDGAGGLTMDPNEVEAILTASATPHRCPDGGLQEYPEIGDQLLEWWGVSWEAFTAECEPGPGDTNGFYGSGIVNAYNAVTYEP